MPPRPILIIGAGVSGLTLAQGLSKHGIPFELYERDASVTARAQGYRFRLSDDGLQALKQNLSDDHFQTFEQSCCSDQALGNGTPNLLDAETGMPKAIPPQFSGKKRPGALSVDRTALRNHLMEGVGQNIHFGKTFRSYSESTDGVTVKFTDGSEVMGSALIGADGTWSRVRQQLLPRTRLVDTEGRLIFGKTNISDGILEKVPSECAKGPSMILSRERKCLLEPMRFDEQVRSKNPDYFYWVLFLRNDEDSMRGKSSTPCPEDTRILAQELTREWDPSLRCLIDEAEQMAFFPIFSASPSISMPGDPDSRVTLIGDAIHPMSPTAGKHTYKPLKGHVTRRD